MAQRDTCFIRAPKNEQKQERDGTALWGGCSMAVAGRQMHRGKERVQGHRCREQGGQVACRKKILQLIRQAGPAGRLCKTQLQSLSGLHGVLGATGDCSYFCSLFLTMKENSRPASSGSSEALTSTLSTAIPPLYEKTAA